ncbi:DHH family phosphoesterase [Alloscardovia venturai]|uniref:DHH family phosphoesterase n=1 Tax=Alloscardovia venturai TaxID=1769421 RepID=A0ABW2Y6U9_9BIFI
MSHYSPLVKKFIERSGLTPEFLRELNTPYGAQLDGMDKFISALHSYKSAEITIAPDFDMDGITSGIILYAGLSQLGFTINLSIPHYEHGHEFGIEDVDDIMHDFPDTKVILTCDCGVNSTEGIRYAQSQGLAVLVTDHHEQETACPADAMIDPCARNSSYPLPGICGAAVAFLMVSAYARRYASDSERKYLNLLILFAGIGTISDVMPLVHDNRFLVRQSLELTRELISKPLALDVLRADANVHPVFLTAFEGYVQLLAQLAIKIENCDEQFYSYTLAPMFNAPRRVGSPMVDAFNVFIGKNEQIRKTAIVHLVAANNKRKKAVAQYMESLDDTYAPYVYITDAPQGMLGLLAGHLMHRSQLPTAVVHVNEENQTIDGSMRAPDYYPIIDMLAHRDGLEVVGHQGACGVRGPLESLTDALTGISVPMNYLPEPVLTIGESDDDVTWWDQAALSSLADFLESIGPFGKNFEYPIFELNIPVGATQQTLGNSKQHLKLSMPGCPPVLLWNTSELPERLFVRLSYNYFRGRKTLQMVGNN